MLICLCRGINIETDTGFDYPIDYEVPTESAIVAHDEGNVASDTFVDESAEHQETDFDEDEEEVNISNKKMKTEKSITAYPNTDAQYSSLVSSVSTSEKKNKWVAMEDPTTGATYYYNEITGESSWGIENEEENEVTPT